MRQLVSTALLSSPELAELIRMLDLRFRCSANLSRLWQSHSVPNIPAAEEQR